MVLGANVRSTSTHFWRDAIGLCPQQPQCLWCLDQNGKWLALVSRLDTKFSGCLTDGSRGGIREWGPLDWRELQHALDAILPFLSTTRFRCALASRA